MTLGAADEPPGQGIIRASWIATAILTVTDGAAAFGPEELLVPGAVVATALFLLGCGLFIGAWAIAANRSRTEAIELYGLVFVSGVGPKRVQRHLVGSLLVQCAVVVTCATVRPATAAGILAPVAGLGFGALWAARHGEFRRR
jgi:hypothetical protein